MKKSGQLFNRFVFAVEAAVLVVILLCIILLWLSLQSLDKLLIQAYELTGQQRAESVSLVLTDKVDYIANALSAEDNFHALAWAAAIREDDSRLKSCRDILREDDFSATNIIYFFKSNSYIGTETMNASLFQEIETLYGVTEDEIEICLQSEAAGIRTKNFRSSNTGEMGIIIAKDIDENAALIRIHFYKSSIESAASQYLDNPYIYYYDRYGLAASNNYEKRFEAFDFSSYSLIFPRMDISLPLSALRDGLKRIPPPARLYRKS